METTEFKEGERVFFQKGDKYKWGTVSSINDTYVFVKFDEQVAKLGWQGTTSQACLPSMLLKEKEPMTE